MTGSSSVALARLEKLALRPPQTLLIEGGSESQRLDTALHWAATINCASAQTARMKNEAGSPCKQCLICQQIQANENIDLLIYDGRITNKQDEEKPGPVKSLRMENMRELKTLTGTAPHGSGKRIVIFQGMSQTRNEALNSLLKTLEEPSQHTLFVLLTPQRDQLLPTLVSRSFCLTLPWTDCLAQDGTMPEWERAFTTFLRQGTGFLESIATRGVATQILAAQIILSVQKALGRALGGKPDGPLDAELEPLVQSSEKAIQASRWLDEAQIMLTGTVAPARVLEALASRLYLLLRQ